MLRKSPVVCQGIGLGTGDRGRPRQPLAPFAAQVHTAANRPSAVRRSRPKERIRVPSRALRCKAAPRQAGKSASLARLSLMLDPVVKRGCSQRQGWDPARGPPGHLMKYLHDVLVVTLVGQGGVVAWGWPGGGRWRCVAPGDALYLRRRVRPARA
jgi:hypothetical protein